MNRSTVLTLFILILNPSKSQASICRQILGFLGFAPSGMSYSEMVAEFDTAQVRSGRRLSFLKLVSRSDSLRGSQIHNALLSEDISVRGRSTDFSQWVSAAGFQKDRLVRELALNLGASEKEISSSFETILSTIKREVVFTEPESKQKNPKPISRNQYFRYGSALSTSIVSTGIHVDSGRSASISGKPLYTTHASICHVEFLHDRRSKELRLIHRAGDAPVGQEDFDIQNLQRSADLDVIIVYGHDSLYSQHAMDFYQGSDFGSVKIIRLDPKRGVAFDAGITEDGRGIEVEQYGGGQDDRHWLLGFKGFPPTQPILHALQHPARY